MLRCCTAWRAVQWSILYLASWLESCLGAARPAGLCSGLSYHIPGYLILIMETLTGASWLYSDWMLPDIFVKCIAAGHFVIKHVLYERTAKAHSIADMLRTKLIGRGSLIRDDCSFLGWSGVCASFLC